MEFKRGRYSWLLRPFLVVFDVLIINSLVYSYFNFNSQNISYFSIQFFNDKHILFILYSTLIWILSTALIGFYKVYNHENVFYNKT